MIRDFDLRLRTYAEVIVHVGLNLQAGQRLIIAEPYEIQGVARTAEALVAAITAIATPAPVEVIWGDSVKLRDYVERKDWRNFAQLTARNADKMLEYVQNGDAVLFLLGSEPRFMEGIPARHVAEARRIASENFGEVAQQLTHGATNWTAAPAPSAGWANAVYGDRPPDDRIAALWDTAFSALRVPKMETTTPHETTLRDRAILDWRDHVSTLQKRRDALNARRYVSLQYVGAGTDLTVSLPTNHVWCSACQRTNSGIPFVANLPTEEVFTAPHRDSTHGVATIARPITFGGAVIDGIELEFRHGQVVKARARVGDALLQRLLATDPGAMRLGEVALVGNDVSTHESSMEIRPPPWSSGRLYYHPLLDENAGSHIALGEGYGFCLAVPDFVTLNRSLLHVDLPIAAKAELR